MARERGRSIPTIALVLVAVLLVLWALRFVIGVFVRVAQFVLVVGLVAVSAFVLYRLWQGWTDAGEDIELTRNR